MRGNSQWRIFCLAWVGLLPGLVAAVGDEVSATGAESKPEPKFDDAAVEFFEKEVRPILTARCVECHGAGKGDPKGGLSLMTRSAALKGGDTGPAVVPAKPKESLLVSAVEYGDLYQMPPKSKLPAAEIATLTKWVELGAPWPKETGNAAGTVKPFDLAARKGEHWCWNPISNPPVPPVKDQAWPNSSADRFILAGLEGKGLKPATPAEKHALLRRVHFDLIGLPPTPSEVAAFVADNSPQAFERVVDRLLDSPHFGERWGRHWLDLVRYAETRGHEFEPSIPNAWQYRDYIIRALNADVPYDRLLTEHVAGDLIESRWRNGSMPGINESVLGTGFWFLGEEVHSPVDIRKDETDRMDNRLDVMSKTFLGLTVSCARCHDHKFDAISQRDYYAMTGFLISGSYRQVRVQTEANDRQIAAKLDVTRAAARQDVVRILNEAARPTLSKLDQYLEHARQAVDAGVTLVDAAAPANAAEVVFADFEGDSYPGWKTEGTAFGDRPPRKGDNEYAAPLEGFRGERLVNSHRNPTEGPNNAGTRDAQLGRLISPSVTIEHPTIRFQIGGGAHVGRTCMNLTVDGKVVRTATGQNSGTLRTEQWQVADLRGKTATIEIVDAEPGGWGHILVDQIVFSKDSSGQNSGKGSRQLAEATQAKVNGIAKEANLDPAILSRWCMELAGAKGDKNHLLHGFATGQLAVKPSVAEESPAGLVVDFANPRPGDVIQDGVSFGVGPISPGQLQFVGTSELRATTVGGWQRDLFWKEIKLTGGTEDDHGGLGNWHRHGRMVRTPEFTLNGGRLWYLVRGAVRAYATVNSHLVLAGPLHGSILAEFKHTDTQWHWVAHGLDQYRGHRLHVEFTPGDDLECGVAMVVQADQPPKLPDLKLNVAIDGGDSSTKRASLLQEQLTNAFARLNQSTDPASAMLVNWMLERRELFVTGASDKAVADRVASLRAEEAKLSKDVVWESQLAPAILDGNGVDELLLIRGNSNTPRDPIHRRFLEAVEGDHPLAEAGSGRLTLARQMLQSPFAARVAVNRIWHHLFGRGIVPSVDNLGVLGQAPTHPELLDHLATQFVKDGWSTKRMIKSLLLTRTYQMSSHPMEPEDTTDPDNLLWHRMPIKRLQGEVIRDALLAVSGRLDPTPFGPSVPIHLTPFMEGRGRPGASGPLDGNGRRSIYIAVRRNFLSPMMLAFDTPSPFSTVGRRTSSNVPAQALILMNDPLVIELAKRWAERLLVDPTLSPEQRIDAMYQAALARPASDAEKSDALAFLDAQSARFGLPETQRRTSPQAWADLCHVMFNVKEFVFIE